MYANDEFDDWTRSAVYVTARDGTRLAADVFQPTRCGKLAADPRPLVWSFTPYLRAQIKEGRLVGHVEQHPWLARMLRRGYVIAAVEVRGTGASFGQQGLPFSAIEQADAYDCIEWFTAQPWCNGRIGMHGRSYCGVLQYLAAAAGHPSLRAIVPEMSLLDLYGFLYPGGIFRRDFVTGWTQRIRELDKLELIAPVDDDHDGALLATAYREHGGRLDLLEVFSTLPHRDSVDQASGVRPFVDCCPSSRLEQIRRSGVAVLQIAGFRDGWCRDAFGWLANLTNPRRLVAGQWGHSEAGGADLDNERYRWFDKWLSGDHCGEVHAPVRPIRICPTGARDAARAWREAEAWPLPEAIDVQLVFAAGPSGTIDSPNDGRLVPLRKGIQPTHIDSYLVDPTTTTGRTSRWVDGYGGGYGYDDMAPNDRRCLTYTTAPLATDTEVIGHPRVRLLVSASADVAIVVLLEDVDSAGVSAYLSEGAIRLSHRSLAIAPYGTHANPWHPSREDDLLPIYEIGQEIFLDLLPVAHVFRAGHRLRIAIACADCDNLDTPTTTPPPIVKLQHGDQGRSCVLLPVVGGDLSL